VVMAAEGALAHQAGEVHPRAARVCKTTTLGAQRGSRGVNDPSPNSSVPGSSGRAENSPLRFPDTLSGQTIGQQTRCGHLEVWANSQLGARLECPEPRRAAQGNAVLPRTPRDRFPKPTDGDFDIGHSSAINSPKLQIARKPCESSDG
jgi:hypothetical protein